MSVLLSSTLNSVTILGLGDMLSSISRCDTWGLIRFVNLDLDTLWIPIWEMH